MIKIELNNLRISTHMIDVIYSHFMSGVREAEDELVELMGEELQQTVDGGGPGKPAWRNSLRQMVRVISTQYLLQCIESEVGLDESIGLSNYVRAKLIAFGGGSAGPSGAPITAGPPGRSVWDDDLSGKHPSSALSQYALPAGFNQPGNEFVANAMKRMQVKFSEIMQRTLRSLSADMMSSCVISSKG